MSLAYVAVSADGIVLSEYSLIGASVQPQVSKLLATKPIGRQSYASDKYIFNLMSRGRVSACAVCNNIPKHQALAFQFLEKIISTFLTDFGENVSALSDVKKFSSILRKELEYFNSPEADKITKLKEEVEAVKNIMTENIEKILERGEKMERVVEKTEDLTHNSEAFFQSSKTLRKKMFWKNVKIMIAIVLLVALIAFMIALVACGGFSFSKCKDTATPAPSLPSTSIPATPSP
jgi:vesicle-associated membrane protein 7